MTATLPAIPIPALMRRHRTAATIAACIAGLSAAQAIEIHLVAPEVGGMPTLVGPDASLQLVVSEGQDDLTRRAVYTTEPEGIVTVDAGGLVKPLADGIATLTVSADGHSPAEAAVKVEQSATPQPINFPNEVVPILTKHGCNGGGCHGKSEGQNGFRLSLLGFTPEEDYGHIVYEARGRRLFPAAPEHSLLLLKGAGEMPHGGGGLIEKGGHDFRTLVRWMEQGMPYGRDTDPVVERLEVFPEHRLVAPGARQQVAVAAHYSDGSVRDVTGMVAYESNQKEMAEVSKTGLVEVKSGNTGDLAVMIRFQELVGVFRATVPRGAPVDDLPPAKNFVDDFVYAKLKTLGLPPSAPCDDETFLRRVTLDVAGRLPTADEVQKFAGESGPDKRSDWIDILLASEDYADYFANKWVGVLRNKRAKANYARGTQGFHDWVKTSLHDNKPYGDFVRELLTAKGQMDRVPATSWFRSVTKREEQLQDVAQVFLGVRLQCAQCHHHPYERWSQDDYYGFAAFFSQLGKKNTDVPAEEAVFHRRGIAVAENPTNKKSLKPTPLVGDALEIPAEIDPRTELAGWITSKENPFFAKMLVNRYWKHFFSRALVEPEDDMRVTNPATNPELLDALATNFTDSGYDLKELVRTICNSQTYQLSGIPNAYNADDRQNYSRYFPKRLGAEVLLDAIDHVTDSPSQFDGQLVGTRAVQLPDDSFNKSSYFLTVFGRPEMDSACECERADGASLAQTLHLLNSKGIQDKLADADGTAAQLARTSDLPVAEKLGKLYLQAFSRRPHQWEIEVARDYVETKLAQAVKAGEDTAAVEKRAYEDLVWATLNTKEFLFNH